MTPNTDVKSFCQTRRRFASRDAAVKNVPAPYRAYLCPHCRNWHLTGGPLRPITKTERTT